MSENSQNNLEKFMTMEHIEGILANIGKNSSSIEPPSEPLRKQINFQCHKEKQQTDCMDGFQFKEFFIYVFAKNYQNTSKITLYSFQKEDGSQKKKTFKQFKNLITCMKIVLQFQKPINQIKKGEDPLTKLKILIGCDDGYLKILDLTHPYAVNHVKIDIKPITMIISGDYTLFENQNICIILANDNFIYFVDLQRLQIAYVMKPMIIMCDPALLISLNHQQTHLMQCTQSGYIILWRMNRIYDFFKQRKNKKNHQEKPLRNYDVFAYFTDHSIAIQGLIWCQFYGHLIILITKQGKLKIVGLIFGNENEFVELLSFKIQNPDSITQVKFFQQLDMLLISKNLGEKHVIQKIHLDHELQVSILITINIEKIDYIHNFYINKQFDILLCRGTKCFVLNKCNQLEHSGSFEKHIEKQKQY